MEERPLWVSPAVVFLSYLYQLPEPTPPIGIFLPSFCRNHKASCTTPERYFSEPSISIRTLAQIRKMGPAVQINIAEKQINTAGQLSSDHYR
jgi:hypothetical protein